MLTRDVPGWPTGVGHHCRHCHGSGVEPDEECFAIPCLACGGCGLNPVTWRLPRSRTHRFRWAIYDPLTRSLTITQGKRTQVYEVRPFDPAPHPEYGVGVSLVKEDGQVYDLRCGPAGVSCDCAGATYESVGKANQRAWEIGAEVYPTLGCVHLDSVSALVRAGWLGLNDEPAASVNGLSLAPAPEESPHERRANF